MSQCGEWDIRLQQTISADEKLFPIGVAGRAFILFLGAREALNYVRFPLPTEAILVLLGAERQSLEMNLI